MSKDDLRVGDAEREAAVERLRGHAAAGRLEPAELEERVEIALSARTAGDLRAVELDLPAASRPPRPPRADRQAACARRSLREHAASYVAVNTALLATWAATGFGYPWFIWPLLGWGIGLASHGQAARALARRALGPGVRRRSWG